MKACLQGVKNRNRRKESENGEDRWFENIFSIKEKKRKRRQLEGKGTKGFLKEVNTTQHGDGMTQQRGND